MKGREIDPARYRRGRAKLLELLMGSDAIKGETCKRGDVAYFSTVQYSRMLLHLYVFTNVDEQDANCMKRASTALGRRNFV